ncbi:MAG: hypothetical protein FJ404_19710, partial [Verrucomicrobia bacterium]|nr:hypothetical protein [Verrucomicrobiota bacterium]
MNFTTDSRDGATDHATQCETGLGIPGTSTHPALDFLAHLDPSPDARFNIECYSDVPKGFPKPKPDPLSRRFPRLSVRDVAALLPALGQLNERGAGVFIARNEFAGPRRAASVKRIRGIHADMDGVTLEQLSRVTEKLKPSIRVQSSESNRLNLYWSLAPDEVLTPDETKKINQSLVQYGADPAAVDVSRLLRLPGFRHMKYKAEGRTPVVTLLDVGPSYLGDDIRSAWIATNQSPKTGTEKPSPELNTHAPQTSIELVAAAVAQRNPELWNGHFDLVPRRSGINGYSSQSEADLALAGKIMRECAERALPRDVIAAAVEQVFSMSGLGQRAKWVERDDYRERTITKAMSELPPPPMAITAAPSETTHVSLLDSHGDIRNAKAFASAARGRFLYVTTRGKWLMWDSGKWLYCAKDEEIAFAKTVCAQILEAATDAYRTNPDSGKRLILEALAAHNLPRILAMLRLAVSEPGMAVTIDELDQDPNLLGVQDGVVDLRTGTLLPNEPRRLITRYAAATFSESVACTRWLKFLEEIFQGDSETIESVQLLLGYTLTGKSTEELLIICFGFGSNGKSIFNNIVQAIMADYAVTAPPSILTVRKAGDAAPRNDLAALAGSRYVSINEMQAGDRLDEQIVKVLAGREPISARFLHREFFEFQPTFTPWLRTNHKPIITGDDDAIWRRLVLVPFRRRFTQDERDSGLEEKLISERNGILKWMIEGARRYLTDGLRLSKRITAEQSAYRKESDLL